MKTPELEMPAGEEPIGSIDDGRARIDEIDARLRELIATRRRISLDIQRRRMADGGPRVEHRRETQVVSSWTVEFGREGAEVARTLLSLCRGRVLR